MKPGKNDIPYKVLITGLELVVLHKLTWCMCEAFGLDRKIAAYKGTRPITLYAWDLDCLDSVTSLALVDPVRHEIQGPKELEALACLDKRLRDLQREDG